MKRKIYIAFILFFSLGISVAQNSKKQLNQILKDAQFFLDADEYAKALVLFKQALHIAPEHDLAGVDAAFCCSKLNYAVDSTVFLEYNLMASKNVDAKYYLAKIKHKQRHFDACIKLLNEYKKTDRKHHLKADDEIDYLIQVCNNGNTLLANSHQAFIKNLGTNINSEFDDYVPIINVDESVMYFTSKRKNASNKKNGDNNFYEDVFVSKRKNEIWQKAESLGFPINTDDNDACVALDNTGTKMIVYRSSATGATGHLYSSTVNEHGHWTNLSLMEGDINSEYIETSACYSEDSATIYFSSNRPGGMGGKDIYRIKRLPNGKWGAAFNLGPTINTKYDEDAPFVHPNGQTLYFSSKGHTTMGEYDVFKSTLNKETQSFSTPENMGYPINDVGNDIFFVLSADGKRGYYSSIKKVNYGGEDIYQIDMRYNDNDLVVKLGYVTTEGVPNKVKLTLKELGSANVEGEFYSHSQTGKFVLAVNPLHTYSILIEEEGYEKIKMTLYPVASEPKNEFLNINLVKKSGQ